MVRGAARLTRLPMFRALWSVAIPAMLTNIATALFGLADVWVIGRTGDAAAQGGVEVGARFLMALLLVFNFLRTATVALTAQAAGEGAEARATILLRALAMALSIAILLLLLRPLAIPFGLSLFAPPPAVADAARAYVGVRYWSALPWLVGAALTGWLVGGRRMAAVLATEVAANILHILLDLWLVLGLALGAKGVALATLLSETVKCLALACIVLRILPMAILVKVARQRATWALASLVGLLRLNRDLFIRTLLLMGVMILFTRTGAGMGETTLAANAILMQLFLFATLILDGFEAASQVLAGEAAGARDAVRLRRAALAATASAGAVAVLLSAALWVGRAPLLSGFSSNAAVVAEAIYFAPWLALLPLASFASYVLDGVYVGATATRLLMVTMAMATGFFLAALYLSRGWGNNGLWLSFALFSLARAVAQVALFPRLMLAVSGLSRSAPLPPPDPHRA